MMRATSSASLPALLLLVLGVSSLAAGPVLAQGRGDSSQRMSPEVVKPLQRAVEHANKGEFAEAEAEVRKAEAVEGKTELEQFQVDDLLGYTLLNQQKYTEAALAYERSLESGLLPEDKVPAQLRVMAQLFFQSEPRNMEKAALYGKRYLEAGEGNDRPILALVSQAAFFSEDMEGAREYVRRAIAAAEAEGEIPDENLLMILQSSSARLEDLEGVRDAYMRLVRHYPSAERWRVLTGLLLERPTNTDRTNLNIFRLMAEVDAFETGDEHLEAANAASQSASPGEAVKFLEAGIEAGRLASGPEAERAQELLSEAKRTAAEDRDSLDEFAAEARAAADGEPDVRLGEAYLSYDRPREAVDAIRRGIGKGGMKSGDEAQLLLGIAQLRSGDVGQAQAAFQKVGGEYGGIAELWLLVAEDRGGSAAPAGAEPVEGEPEGAAPADGEAAAGETEDAG